VVREREEQYQRERQHRPKPHPRRNGTSGPCPPPKDLRAQAEHFAARLTPDRRAELARVLGLPESVLATLPLLGFSAKGFHEDYYHQPCFTFPELDGDGRVVGISCRYPDHEKKAKPGGSRGLTVPDGWQERDGPLYLPEGQSDTLALTAMGLPAVGRPSNTGGVDQLADLLSDLPADREVIVLGEYDPKPDGRWPGMEGAVQTAKALAGKPGRRVSWALTPGGAKVKDVRAWVSAQHPDVTCSDIWSELGERFVSALKVQTVEPVQAAGFRWAPIDSGTLARTDYWPSWLVTRVLVAGQAAVVGGARKMMKTSIDADLAVSLATASRFLGHFEVPAAVRVAFLSAESGYYTLKETAERICRARGLDLAALAENLLWQDTLPQFSNAGDLAELTDGLRRDGVGAVILDPTYLAMLAGQGPGGARAESLFDMGPLLLGVARACLAAGATPILSHHARKGVAGSLEPLDLDDLAFAGIAEFARQWLLLSRREHYEPGTGQHRLWLSVGGSMGHGGLWSVDIAEGVIDENFTGRRWDVAVGTAVEARQSEQHAVEEAKREKKSAQDRADDNALLVALDQLDPEQKGAGLNQVKDAAALSDGRMLRAVLRLKGEKVIREAPVEVEIGSGAKRTAKGLVRCADG
jgi:replicative DNA helicase